MTIPKSQKNMHFKYIFCFFSKHWWVKGNQYLFWRWSESTLWDFKFVCEKAEQICPDVLLKQCYSTAAFHSWQLHVILTKKIAEHLQPKFSSWFTHRPGSHTIWNSEKNPLENKMIDFLENSDHSSGEGIFFGDKNILGWLPHTYTVYGCFFWNMS